MVRQSGSAYRRVDTAKLAPTDAEAPGPITAGGGQSTSHVRWGVVPLSVGLCVMQMVLDTIAQHTRGVIITSTLISVLAFGALFVAVLVVNPILGAVLRGRVLRPLSRAELVCVFSAMLITAGISSFGLGSQLVPLVGAPWNPEWNTAQRGWQERALPHLNESLYLSIPADGTSAEQQEARRHIEMFRQGIQPVGVDGEPMNLPSAQAPWHERIAYGRAVFQQLPWQAWLKPLSLWLVFVLACYGMFYALTYMALPLWARREKLIFPLARLPAQLLPDPESGWLPPVLVQSGFWAGFAVSFLLLSWNGAVASEWLAGMGRIGMGMDPGKLLAGSALEGLRGGHMPLTFLIIFTAIGIAFLLPTEISFSLWFYFLVGKAMILLLIWMGYGQTGGDFPTDMRSTNNVITAQGGGALLMFAAITLWRVLQDNGRSCCSGPWPARFRKSLPLVGLIACLTVIVSWLTWNDLPLVASLLIAGLLALLTIGLMRLVAEGGVYWFQLHTGPFHLFNVFALGKVFKGLTLAPLLPIYSVLFLDVKTFLAPNLANAAKMQDDLGAGRRTFHVNLVLCTLVSLLTTLGLSVYLAHLFGAQQMHPWFYSQAPQIIMDNVANTAVAKPESNVGHGFAYGVGGAWTVISMALRRTMFWFPHPIGYVMLVSPLMARLWFSFMLGWIAKKCVVRYGGKRTFDLVQPIFIGLILGELVAILVWSILGLAYGFEAGLTLNRYRP